MEAFWISLTQFFWWTMSVISAVGFVVMSIVLVCAAMYLNDKEKMSETK